MCVRRLFQGPEGSLRARVLTLLAKLVSPMHRTNASGNNMSQR